MSITSKAVAAYKMFKTVKNIKKYGSLVLESINDDTRPGGLMKLGINGMLKIGGKFLGTSLTSHPYFTYHKAHLEALAQALNASSNHDKALDALNAAIRSADASGAIAKSITSYQTRREHLNLSYAFIISTELDMMSHKSDPTVALQIKESGYTPESFIEHVSSDVYEWRAKWCELYLDILELLAMAQVEMRSTEAAMQVYRDKMKALKSGGSIGTIAAYSVEQDQLWQQYDRAVKPQDGKSEKAVSDPTGYARDQVRTIQKISDLIGEGCDAAMAGVIDYW